MGYLRLPAKTKKKLQMNAHWEINDEEFESLFQKGLIPARIFTHEAHLRLAWIHICKYGTENAVKNIDDQLSKYVDRNGAGNKYNKTLTVAAIMVVSHFINKHNRDSFSDFIKRFPGLKYNFKALLARHYQRDIYHSEQAKKKYMEPDLLPFL